MNQAHLHSTLFKLQQKAKKQFQLSVSEENEHFKNRLAANLGIIDRLFFTVYNRSEHSSHFNQLIGLLFEMYKLRPETLKKIDLQRVENPSWYQSEQMAGMQLYVDRFNKNLKGVTEKLPYFEELGVNFLHLMPVMKSPKGENDGGYAVSSYHEVDSRFGTNADLLALTGAMHKKGMYVMMDFVVNHTSDEHEWAKKAKKGDKKYQDFYYVFPNRVMPDLFDASMPEVFPEIAPGNFTFDEDMQQWVMTVFNKFQWDLNYTNPEVFNEMFKNLMLMSNLGIDIIRFDALAFLWKKIGTISQNLPEAHILVQLFRMCAQVVAPGMVFLAEAIVSPKEIIKYFGEGEMEGNESEVAYNATFMALLWESIATKETRLIRKSIYNVPPKPKSATWINYARCHDDIGLGFENQFVTEVGWDPYEHRKFITDYYCQKLDWSPAKGLMFMYNPKTGDGRISGSMASLCGLEKGLEKNDDIITEQAVAKINMLHAIILSYGGIPMIYSGDEIATVNDYSFLKDAKHKNDNRWVHRPKLDWDVVENLKTFNNHQNEVFFTLKKLIALRKTLPILADANNVALEDCPNMHVLAFMRWSFSEDNLLVLNNFNDRLELVDAWWLHKIGFEVKAGITNLITGKAIKLTEDDKLELQPYEFMWLRKG